MFRLQISMSHRLFNGLAVSASRSRFVWKADDVTKHISGCLHTQQRGSHQGLFTPNPHNVPSTHFLRLNPLPRTARSVLSVNSVPCFTPGVCNLQVLNYSTSPDKPGTPEGDKEPVTEVASVEEKLSIFQRFKRAYKEHGKILVAVHVATSIVWYGSFYALARGGLDIVPYLEQWGFSDTIIKPFRAGGLGDFALAYLLYKLATPARYTVTLAGTNIAIRQLRSRGVMAPKSQEDSLRELYKEGRQNIKNSNLRQDRLKKLKSARDKRKADKLKKRK